MSSTADALRRKLREREGRTARQELLRRLASLGVDGDALSWLSPEESDALVEGWISALGLPPGDQLTFRPRDTGLRTWTYRAGTPAPSRVPAPGPAKARVPRLLVLFGDYRTMGIASADPQWVADCAEPLAVADGNGFVAVTESLDYVLQVDLEETGDQSADIEVTLWGDA
ncbi:hypothetical protein AB0N81_26610 [Streptomyces sp. NPDC093510]|uniref:hypothetical protein n=1 Tax=Streptomyces sp. NPDC093510 TaxID=3155199 RepID=UPI003421E7E2